MSVDLRDLLLADQEFSRFVRAVALSARFHLYLMHGSAEMTDPALGILKERVSAIRGGPVRLTMIDPYEAVDTPSDDDLVSLVLTRLLSMGDEDTAPDCFVVVKATGAVSTEHERWSYLFQRMNERRNSILKRITVPLLLCLPGWMEVLFTQAAPDFWSVRSESIRLPGQPPSAPTRISESAEPPLLVYLYADEDQDLAQELEKHLSPLVRAGKIRGWSRARSRQGTIEIKESGTCWDKLNSYCPCSPRTCSLTRASRVWLVKGSGLEHD